MKQLLLPLFLITTITVTGCAPVLVGGAAVGGYYVGKDERSIGTITDDAAITTKINGKYARDDLIRVFDINVDTYRGIVTLYGRVSSQQTADRAVSLARQTPGVQKVISKLTIIP